MIVILHQASLANVAHRISAALESAFHGVAEISMESACSASEWPAIPAWDDLLIVLFDGEPFPAVGDRYVGEYLAAGSGSRHLLPVATSTAHSKPPPGASSSIKALSLGLATESDIAHVVTRAGSMLGLRLQGRDGKIFISYRARDGVGIAKQLEKHLSALGYDPWLDEAKEIDGDTKILPGNSVQQEIDKALVNANLVLLIDTKGAKESRWIQHEVTTANALMIPVLPVCIRDVGDSRKGTRFPSLAALQRFVQFSLVGDTVCLLNDTQLDQIVAEAEQYICETFRRKCRVPFLVKGTFAAHGYSWEVLDVRLHMFAGTKQHPALKTRVISHCSIFDQIHLPALEQFGRQLKRHGSHNYSLFVYDGDLLPQWDLDELVSKLSEGPSIVLHHQELSELIRSNFTHLRKI